MAYGRQINNISFPFRIKYKNDNRTVGYDSSKMSHVCIIIHLSALPNINIFILHTTSMCREFFESSKLIRKYLREGNKTYNNF